MSKKCDHLDDCLERLLQGEELESCLEDYPEEADELRLLLKTADRVKWYSETVKPCPEFVAQAQVELEKVYENKYYSWKARIAGILKPVGRFMAATATAVIILAFTFTAGLSLSVLASEDTMPGQALYPVKLATEQIRVTFTFSASEKVNLLAQFAEIRAEEIVYAAEKGDTAQMEATLGRLEAHLSEVENICSQDTPNGVEAIGNKPAELQRIEIAVKSSSTKSMAKLNNVPVDPEEKDEIIARVDEAYSKAIKAIESAR